MIEVLLCIAYIAGFWLAGMVIGWKLAEHQERAKRRRD